MRALEIEEWPSFECGVNYLRFSTLNQGIAQDVSVDTADGHSFSVQVNYFASYRVPDCKIV